MAAFDLGAFLDALKSDPEAMQQIRQVLDTPDANPWTPITPEQKVQHFTKLVTHGMKADKPYVHQAFPTMMFHPSKDAVIVKTPAQRTALGPEWADAPFEERVDLTIEDDEQPEQPMAKRRGRQPKSAQATE